MCVWVGSSLGFIKHLYYRIIEWVCRVIRDDTSDKSHRLTLQNWFYYEFTQKMFSTVYNSNEHSSSIVCILLLFRRRRCLLFTLVELFSAHTPTHKHAHTKSNGHKCTHALSLSLSSSCTITKIHKPHTNRSFVKDAGVPFSLQSTQFARLAPSSPRRSSFYFLFGIQFLLLFSVCLLQMSHWDGVGQDFTVGCRVSVAFRLPLKITRIRCERNKKNKINNSLVTHQSSSSHTHSMSIFCE